MIRIGFLVPDNRQEFSKWDLPEPYFGPAPQALLDGFAQCDECEVHVIFCLKRPMPTPARLARNIFLHSEVVSPRGFMTTLNAGCIRAIRRLVRQLKLDVVHGQGSERYPAICAALSGLPNVLTLHGNMRELARFNQARPLSYHWVAALLESIALRRTDGVVCISSYTRSLVGSLPPRVWTVPNAADDPFFDIVLEPSPTPEILCVGYVDKRKNQTQLIRALDPLAKELVFKVVFLGNVGDDPLGLEFKNMLAPRPWCEARGFADRASLRAALQRASLLALPSLEENCPMVVLEAMAAGLPVAAANVGGVPDLVQHETTGLLFDPLNPDSIAQAIRRLLVDPQLRSRMGQAGKAMAEQRFRPKVVARRHLEIYRELLGR